MSNELIINSTQNGCRIALLKNKVLTEFHHQADSDTFKVGDIYLGTVRKVVQGLNAAFIDIGYEKDAFLHYLDLGPRFSSLQDFSKRVVTSKKGQIMKLEKYRMKPEIDKHGKITDALSRNQKVLVQVVKEPISTKGPRLSCELSLAGRYMVLVPFSNTVNISKKITSAAERKRLSRLVSSIKPDNFGVIVRTVAENKDVRELDQDLRNLVDSWEAGMEKLKTAKPRDIVIGEISKASSLLRDVLNESFDSIYIDDKPIYDEVKGYIKTIAPDKEKIVKQYNGRQKIFEQFGIEKQIKSAFGQSVSLRGGGYLIVEHTEALHVIDVNSGNKSNREDDQEATAVSVNIEAAKEIARQLRLRDMGGIIVVDFIDMKKAENKKLIQKIMKDEMESDRSKHTVLPLSRFGLMQITRQRVRPEMNIATKEVCPACHGTGKISPSILTSDNIEKTIDYLLTKQNEKEISLVVHPYVHAFFTHGTISRRVKWYLKYFKWVKVIQDSSLAVTDFKFLDKNGEDIQVTTT